MLRPYTAPPLHLARGPRIFRAVATQLTCPSCRAEIPRGAAFCAACGSASPTVITDERAVVRSPSPEAKGGQGVRTTLERLARALGPKYEVKRLIGRGGFAEVYELWDKDLDRRLACKVLHPEIAWTPGMLARFRQEAKALARLQDPAILAIHFTGRRGPGLLRDAFRRGRVARRALASPRPVHRGRRLEDRRADSPGTVPRPHPGPRAPRHQARQRDGRGEERPGPAPGFRDSQAAGPRGGRGRRWRRKNSHWLHGRHGAVHEP